MSSFRLRRQAATAGLSASAISGPAVSAEPPMPAVRQRQAVPKGRHRRQTQLEVRAAPPDRRSWAAQAEPANASSTATSSGSGAASSSANATGGVGGGDLGGNLGG